MRIQSTRVWICGQFMPAQLEIKGTVIAGIYPYKTAAVEFDYGDKRLLPGFIDIHTHGNYGFDTNDARPEGLRHWMANVPEEGVTGILPTTVTQMPEFLTKAVANVAAVVKEGYEGAEILGIHFEGPYLCLEYKGAQPPEAIVRSDVEQFKHYQEAAGGLIKYITLAPEKDEDFTLTKYCRENGVVVSMGHSAATYEQAMLGIANGASSMTHVFNGMSSFKHRSPGLVGAAMRVRDIYGEIIGDGRHCHLAALNNYFTAKGRDFAIMITDSLRAKNCPPGETFELGGHPVEVRDNGLAYLKGTDTIAGSTLAMNQGLRILIEEAMIPVDAAIHSCTINPARCLGVDDRKGKLVAGYDADIVVLEDDYRVTQTYCRGRAAL